jgi:hypothetical protein
MFTLRDLHILYKERMVGLASPFSILERAAFSKLQLRASSCCVILFFSLAAFIFLPAYLSNWASFIAFNLIQLQNLIKDKKKCVVKIPDMYSNFSVMINGYSAKNR